MNTEKKKKYDFLITGISGYIGINLSNYLLKNNFKVLGIDDFSNSERKNIIRLKKKYKNLKFYNQSYDQIPKKILVDNVIHLAAKSSVEKKGDKINEYKSNNIIKLKKLLSSLKRIECKKFIFSSSAAVYKETNLKISENFTCNPKSFYGKSKLIGEKLIKKLSKKKNVQFTILRFFNVIGGVTNYTKNSSVVTIWKNNLKKNKKLIVHDKGNCCRDFVDINYILKVILKISKNKKNYKYNLFNIGSGKSTKLISLLNLFKKLSKKKINVKFENLPKNSIKISMCNNKKIIKFFKMRPQTKLKKIIETFISKN